MHQLNYISDKWWSALGPVPFYIFNNDVELKMKSTLSRFADGTKLSGVVDTPEGWDIVQRDQNKYKKQPMGIT